MKKWLLWIPLVIFVGLCVMFADVILTGKKGISEYMRKPVPVFELGELGNPGKIYSEKDLVGEITVVSFWATWCPPCREEHPVLVTIAQEYPVRMVGINYKDDPKAAEQWLQDYGNPYAFTLVDQEGRVGIEWGVIGIPEMYLVDAQGEVRYKHTGPVTLSKWEDEIWPLICSWTNNASEKCLVSVGATS